MTLFPYGAFPTSYSDVSFDLVSLTYLKNVLRYGFLDFPIENIISYIYIKPVRSTLGQYKPLVGRHN